MTARLLDQAARDRIVAAHNENLFVDAGTVSGKTRQLVDRVVSIVALGSLESIRGLAAITFTENAATELRTRIREALEDAAGPAAGRTAEERTRCARALEELDDAAITTLHGFAARLLTDALLEAGLPPGFRIQDAVAASLDRDTWWRSQLDGWYADQTLAEVWRAGLTLDLSPAFLREVVACLRRQLGPAGRPPYRRPAPAGNRGRDHPRAAPPYRTFPLFGEASDDTTDLTERGKKLQLPLYALAARQDYDTGAMPLRDDAEIRAARRERWQVVCVDEFQDTDPLQVELVHLIAGLDEGSWAEAAIDGGRLFFVGDTKQSIYRFRRAELALFAQVRDQYADGRVSLVQNFRSRPGVLQVVNEVEAEHVASALVRARGSWLAGGTPETIRPASFGDMAILVPTRTSLGQLKEALDRHAVPYRIMSRSLVWESDAVRDLITVLQSIDDPADPVALMAALRHPMFGCSDDDLVGWKAAGVKWRYDAAAPDGAAESPVAHALAALHEYHDLRSWLPVNVLLDRIIRERRAVELTAAHRRPRDHWRRLRFLVHQARLFLDSGGAGLTAFVRWAREQVDAADAGKTVTPERDDDAVQILTIHSSKGLEFPIVALTGINTPRLTRGHVIWPPGTSPEVTLHKGFKTPGFAAAQQAEQMLDQQEDVRLLYVGMTRAADHLIVSLYHHPPQHGNPDTHAMRLHQMLAVCEAAGAVHEMAALPADPRVLEPAAPNVERQPTRVASSARAELLRSAVSRQPTTATGLVAAEESQKPLDPLEAAASGPMEHSRPGRPGWPGPRGGARKHSTRSLRSRPSTSTGRSFSRNASRITSYPASNTMRMPGSPSCHCPAAISRSATSRTPAAVTSVSSSSGPSRTASSTAVHDVRPGSSAAITGYGQPGIISAWPFPRPYTWQNKRSGLVAAPGRSRLLTSTASLIRPSGQHGSGRHASDHRSRAISTRPAFTASYSAPWPRRCSGASDSPKDDHAMAVSCHCDTPVKTGHLCQAGQQRLNNKLSGRVWLAHRGDACRRLSGQVGPSRPRARDDAGGHTGGVSYFAAEALAEGPRALTQDPARAAVFCDIDGTLASFVDRADDAQAPGALSRFPGALGRRCACVARVSGSPRLTAAFGQWQGPARRFAAAGDTRERRVLRMRIGTRARSRLSAGVACPARTRRRPVCRGVAEEAGLPSGGGARCWRCGGACRSKRGSRCATWPGRAGRTWRSSAAAT